MRLMSTRGGIAHPTGAPGLRIGKPLLGWIPLLLQSALKLAISLSRTLTLASGRHGTPPKSMCSLQRIDRLFT